MTTEGYLRGLIITNTLLKLDQSHSDSDNHYCKCKVNRNLTLRSWEACVTTFLANIKLVVKLNGMRDLEG